MEMICQEFVLKRFLAPIVEGLFSQKLNFLTGKVRRRYGRERKSILGAIFWEDRGVLGSPSYPGRFHWATEEGLWRKS